MEKRRSTHGLYWLLDFLPTSRTRRKSASGRHRRGQLGSAIIVPGARRRPCPYPLSLRLVARSVPARLCGSTHRATHQAHLTQDVPRPGAARPPVPEGYSPGSWPGASLGWSVGQPRAHAWLEGSSPAASVKASSAVTRSLRSGAAILRRTFSMAARRCLVIFWISC